MEVPSTPFKVGGLFEQLDDGPARFNLDIIISEGRPFCQHVKTTTSENLTL